MESQVNKANIKTILFYIVTMWHKVRRYPSSSHIAAFESQSKTLDVVLVCHLSVYELYKFDCMMLGYLHVVDTSMYQYQCINVSTSPKYTLFTGTNFISTTG